MCITKSSLLKQALFLSLITLSTSVVMGEERLPNSRFFIIEPSRAMSSPEPSPELTYDIEIKPTNVETGYQFALKTNLLFDALTLINVELEAPVSQRVSIAAEWIFPWWTMDNGRSSSKRNRLQLLNGNLEVRYWLGDRSNLAPLTGWFAGLYAGAGSYDLEYHAKGYQGEFFIAAGASGGYAHTINKKGNLRMEYSLGVGYMATDYHYYKSEYCINNIWHAVEHRKGRYKWFGPTRAKVSLSLLINTKSNRW